MQVYSLNLEAESSPEKSVPSYRSKGGHNAQQCYFFTQLLLPQPLDRTHADPEWHTQTE